MVTRNARRRGRGGRRARDARVERDASVEHGAGMAREARVGPEIEIGQGEQPRNPNQDILDAIQNLIGVVQQRLPTAVVHPSQQMSEEHRTVIRERTRSPPPNRSGSHAELEGESVHRLESPPGVELRPVLRVPRDIGDEIRELLRLQPPPFQGSTDGSEAESFLLCLERCYELCAYGRNLKAHFSIHLLQGSASKWWDEEKAMGDIDMDTLT